ncbi:hypothetical protein AQUCO_03300132v1 [Aquilegia coerulea]|uniref:NAD-dependent epimerase/dehydratase domain-containing protein n=1 Tax=Aquilegia coerulea TaxID=218851 RepID=A0A2G5CZL6_AQUCA|nr:hypothetical protein AQUCO_03300132v1 [Aquilegia coerulea]
MPEYCVTGGNGFIAAYIVQALLEKGYNVRATVRNPGDLDKVGFLLEMKGAKERLKLLKADLLEDGSFDEAVQGVDGVFHTASPVLIPKDSNIQTNLIDPCIKGTLNVLTSCSKASSVKRVVLTSSCSAIRYRDDVQQVSPLNESHWSDLEYCQRNNLWYAYAKTLGEKEAWRLAKEFGIDLVVVNPSFVVGPLISPQPTSTLLTILEIVKAMEDKRAAGRLICSSSVAHMSEIIEMLKAKYPSYPCATKCSNSAGDNNPHSMDTSKINDLGLPVFKTIPQMFDDCIRSFQGKGFL